MKALLALQLDNGLWDDSAEPYRYYYTYYYTYYYYTYYYYTYYLCGHADHERHL